MAPPRMSSAATCRAATTVYNSGPDNATKPGQAPPQNACHGTARTGDQRRSLPSMQHPHRLRRAAPDRTKIGAGVADPPQQSATRWHGAPTMGAHGRHEIVGDDRGVVEQQCSTAHESDVAIAELRTEEILRGTAKRFKIVHDGATGYFSAHARTKGCAERAGYSTALRGSNAYSQYYGVHRGTQSTRILKEAVG